MPLKIQLTSFNTWLPHHQSNASDDLLSSVSQIDCLPYDLKFLQKLPVDFQLAPDRVIAECDRTQPDAIICCGMAESRDKLTVESQANNSYEVLKTSLDLERIVANLSATEISHNAGKFVCEKLYYEMLKYTRDRQLSTQCLFVHVPILTPENSRQIEADFLSILQRIQDLSQLNRKIV